MSAQPIKIVAQPSVVIKGEVRTPAPWPEDARSIIQAQSYDAKLSDLPQAVQTYLDARGVDDDEMMMLEWRVSPTDFEIRVKVKRATQR